MAALMNYLNSCFFLFCLCVCAFNFGKYWTRNKPFILSGLIQLEVASEHVISVINAPWDVLRFCIESKELSWVKTVRKDRGGWGQSDRGFSSNFNGFP